MKLSTLFAFCLFALSSAAQNISINVLTQNSGVVNQGGTVFLEVTLCNTDGSSATPTNKVRSQISVPSALVTIPASGHQLPAGWSIISNTGSVIRICNGTDAIPANSCRTVLIAMQGVNIGGPSSIVGAINFANGTSCSVTGGSTTGDLTADNSSTSTVQVIAGTPTPVTLIHFEAALKDCKPVLTWRTDNEENSDRFIIERSSDNQTWEPAAIVTARGNSATQTSYQFADETAGGSRTILYRLKMVDQDATYQYSGVVQVYQNCKTIKVKVFPNPVQGRKLQINVSGAGERTEARLLSLSGQLILRSVLRNGNNVLNLPATANGTYVLSINVGNQTIEKTKVSIQN